MVIRYYAKCTTCGEHYTIRYSVGNGFPQSASFFCLNCGEKLVMGFKNQDESIFENLVQTKREGKIVNLHPEALIDPKFQQSDFHFASIDLMRNPVFGFENIDKLKLIQVSILKYEQQWEMISKDYRLLKENRWNLLTSKYGADQTKTKNKILKQVIAAGWLFIDGEWTKIYNNVAGELLLAKQKTGFVAFKTYIESKAGEILIDKMFSIMSEYYNVRTELLVTLIAQKAGIKIEGFSSSVNWEKIEMVYGNFYELYGDLLFIPSGINNIIQRNDYSLFLTPGFSFSNYLQSDKAGRCTNFITNANLKALSDYYEASIRNGTHHKTSKIDKTTQEIILATGKAGQTQKTIPFVDYIAACNEVYARSLVLFIIATKII